METLLAMSRGAALTASMIVAIGAQNAHVLRQGIERFAVLPVVSVCILADALLISAGVAGAGVLVRQAPWLLLALRWLGAAYLFWFAATALRRALGRGGRGLVGSTQTHRSVRGAVVTTLVLTFLNPHVYLDTVVLIGSIAARETAELRPAFAVGAISVSCGWFIGLGYGARLLSPLFANPNAWRVLDALIALLVSSIALSLLW